MARKKRELKLKYLKTFDDYLLLEEMFPEGEYDFDDFNDFDSICDQLDESEYILFEDDGLDIFQVTHIVSKYTFLVGVINDNINFDFDDEFTKHVNEPKKEKQETKKLTPKQIKSELDGYIIKQDKTKITLASALHNHLKRKEYYQSHMDSEINPNMTEPPVLPFKNVVTLIGNTGTGKTWSIKTLANVSGLPYFYIDASKLSNSGYVGESLSQKLALLVEREQEKYSTNAPFAILMIDEVDKLVAQNANQNSYLQKIQAELLGILEGQEMTIKDNNLDGGTLFSTKNMLIILAGAFVGLDKILEKRNKKKTGVMGFNVATEEIEVNYDIINQDLIDFGLIPELIGRVTDIVKLEDLEESDLVRIIKESKNSALEQFKLSFWLDEISLEIEDGAYVEIAKRALKLNTGARSLATILSDILKPILFEEIDGKPKVITIKNNLSYTVKLDKESRLRLTM